MCTTNPLCWLLIGATVIYGIAVSYTHLSRLQQCCKAQSAQIDKAKIGQEVKGIPSVWINRNKLKKNRKGEVTDRHLTRKVLYNRTLLDKYPYFFKYVYKDTNKSYKKYLDESNVICKQKYKVDLQTLESSDKKTDEQKEFLRNFYEYCPVTISDSPMNLLCRYLESINFKISQKINSDASQFDCEMYKNPDYQYEEYTTDVFHAITQFLSEKKSLLIAENMLSLIHI